MAVLYAAPMEYLHVYSSGARLLPSPDAIHGTTVVPVQAANVEAVRAALACGDIARALSCAITAPPKKEKVR